MRYIMLKPNPSGAYPPIMESGGITCPAGCAIIPDNIDTSEFNACGGFVELTVNNGTVTEITANREAYEAWKNSYTPQTPEKPEDDGTISAAEAIALLLSEDDE